MSRSPRIPSYRLHKASGQAVVVLNRTSIYLGTFGSPASKAEYRRVIAEWLANHRQLPPRTPTPPAAAPAAPALTVNELVLRYWQHVKTYYVKDGRPTSEQDTIRQALRFLTPVYGHTPAAAFGPLALKAVRERMTSHTVVRTKRTKDGSVVETKRLTGLARTYLNKQVTRVKRMFAWAAENELLPVTVYQALKTVGGLRKDRSTSRDKEPVRPVAPADVEAVLPHLPPAIRTMIRVQLLCGARPQDIVNMKPQFIDRTGPVWEYRPGRHKGEHRGRDRIIFLGPKAQQLLAPFLDGLRPDESVFSPARSEASRLAELRKRRGRPVVKRERDRGKWRVRDHYDVASYRRAIRRVCVKLKVPIWYPLQLRHNAGTTIRQRFGLEASQAVLGHAELSVTQVYSEVDLGAARRVMSEVG